MPTFTLNCLNSERMATDFSKLSDAELLDRSAAGEEGAFTELVSRYKNGLYAFLHNFLNQADAIDDVFQETFLQLFTSKESFDRTRPLRPWLYTIAANKAKDALRKMQRNATVSIGTMSDSDEMSFDDMLNVLTSEEERPYDDLEKGEIAANVRGIISNMPDNLREILVMAYFNHFSYKQMSDVLRIPIGTVKSRLHTAVGRFAKDWKAAVRSKKTQ
jgi:RNA polymerase sigma-70 factor, ECF subfamily